MKDTSYGVFVGQLKFYQTVSFMSLYAYMILRKLVYVILKHCTCYDFQGRKLPCKHIYRLAVELGIIEVISRSERNESVGRYKPNHLAEILALEDPNQHEEQRVRQRNARKCVIIDIDVENQTATFKSSVAKPYSTTLESCTCHDFGMRKLPCKHIYRLAHECGKFDLDNVPDGYSTRQCSYHYSRKLTTEESERLDNLTQEAALILRGLINEWISMSRNEWLFDRENSRLMELVDSGFMEEFDSPQCVLGTFYMKKLRAILRPYGIVVRSKSEAIEKIMEVEPKVFHEAKGEYLVLRFKEECLPIRGRIRTRLRPIHAASAAEETWNE
jgi:hypothetical protein